MATVTLVSSLASSVDSTGAYTCPSFTWNPGDVIVAFVFAGDTVSNGTFILRDAGEVLADVELTRITTAQKATSRDRVHLYAKRKLGGATSYTMTPVFQAADDAPTGVVIAVLKITGIVPNATNDADLFRQTRTASNEAGGAAPSITFSFDSALATNPIIGFVANEANPAGLTAPSSFTELLDTGYDFRTSGGHCVKRDSGHTSATVTWGSVSASQFAGIIAELDNIEDADGTASSTLGSATQSASGSERMQGAASSTLGSATQSASGTHTPPTISGTHAATLGSATQSASGTNTPPTMSGAMSSTLDNATQSASGQERIEGASAATLDSATQNAEGAETIEGASAATLDDVQHEANGAETIEGASASTLDDVQQSAVAEERIEGASASTLDNVTQAMSGATGAGLVAGAMTSTLGEVEQEARGRAFDPCCANTIPIRACGQESRLTQFVASHCVKVNQPDTPRKGPAATRRKVPRHAHRR